MPGVADPLYILARRVLLDVLRLLQAVPTNTLAEKLRVLQDNSVARQATREAIVQLENLFSLPTGFGTEMAVRAVGVLDDSETIRASCRALATDLLTACRKASE